jgi:hypothetical protein
MPWRGVVGCWLATPLLLAAAACLHTAATARQVGPHTWPNMTLGDMSHSFWGSTGALPWQSLQQTAWSSPRAGLSPSAHRPLRRLRQRQQQTPAAQATRPFAQHRPQRAHRPHTICKLESTSGMRGLRDGASSPTGSAARAFLALRTEHRTVASASSPAPASAAAAAQSMPLKDPCSTGAAGGRVD